MKASEVPQDLEKLIYAIPAFTGNCLARYAADDTAARRDRLVKAEMDARNRGVGPDPRAEMAAKTKRLQERTAAQVDAIRRNDQKRLAELEAEERAEKASDTSKSRDAQVVAAVEPYLLKDVSAEVNISFNQGASSREATAVPLAGATAAFRTQGHRNGATGWYEGKTTVLLGRHVKRGEQWDLPGLPADPQKVYGITITITAADERANELLRRLDLASLRALIASD